MDLEWATDTITRFQSVLDEAEEEHNGDAMAIIGGTNDLYEWAEGVQRAAVFLLGELTGDLVSDPFHR